MMRFGLLVTGLLIAASLFWTNLVGAGPVKGPELNLNEFVLPSGRPGIKKITERFVGGERACVLLFGDHDPVEDISIEVFDDRNKLVAKDDGKGDYCVVVWYPPQTGDYTIVFRHNSHTLNQCYVVIK